MTSLSSLRNFDPTTASAILASAILRSSDIAADPELAADGAYPAETANVLAEVRNILGLSSNDASAKALRRIDSFIAAALDQFVQPADGGKSALNRAGQLGRLSPSMFKIEVGKRFLSAFEMFGFRKPVVERAIREADAVQHLLPELIVPKAFSIFMKLENVAGVDQRHWALLQTSREGRQLVVRSAWRVFPSDVDISQAAEPLDMLRSFVEKYGAYMRFGTQRAKFIYQEHTNADPEAESYDLHFDVEDQPKDFFTQAVGGPTTTPGQHTHGPFFCIDMGAYKRDLRAHGFHSL